MSNLAELDQRLVAVAKGVRVLGALSFPDQVAVAFVESWKRGDPALPEPPEVAVLPDAVTDELRAIERAVDPGDPRGRFLRETAESYRQVAGLLCCAGTSEFYERSAAIYGSANSLLPGAEVSHLEVARRLLDTTEALAAATPEHEADYCLSAEHVAARIRARIDAFFGDASLRVVIDPSLASKAAASAVRIRIRGLTCFSDADIGQLVEHEAFVHSATALNGRLQPHLKSLSLGAPRTTATQEGLATFAELTTGVMDLARLRRIALRVHAVHLAEQGADLLDVFHAVLEAGQTPSEAAQTALRIFRGAPLGGGAPFTKDVVYLRGLFAVHTFLRRAIIDVRPDLVARLFVGRLTLSDALAFDELGDLLEPPRYVPPWAANLRSLATYLSMSAVASVIDLSALSLDEVTA
ncbi:MAG: DUF1704 domain-containing protein [Polyangiaceae bacterium]